MNNIATKSNKINVYKISVLYFLIACLTKLNYMRSIEAQKIHFKIVKTKISLIYYFIECLMDCNEQ